MLPLPAGGAYSFKQYLIPSDFNAGGILHPADEVIKLPHTDIEHRAAFIAADMVMVFCTKIKPVSPVGHSHLTYFALGGQLMQIAIDRRFADGRMLRGHSFINRVCCRMVAELPYSL